MARINIRVDDELKETFEDMGLDLTTTITLFIKYSVNSGELPFKPATKKQIENMQARAEAESDKLKAYDDIDELLKALNE
ncbi:MULTISPECIES: type II toxin-antitoxin system RelB/DinJ family antitoxin [Aerococcus]|uniref:Type II toxin-antitoxin system antitoxin, RelB/DinJ family n=1 Tax=Aerococcus urinae TaxID=1376 RepID=A0A329P0W9_9LACT|nr:MULTISPECIES: type II toxin-antitoxin system RelB/DinJ family antitoxin [Aerococcus]MDK6729052.1 type II toxin-antitoxin system RelB/DinJ family antitoxin [Aerococcus urinae]RAV81455.1 type II toxin-antitoxin system antitoxin, RelB/DinJ family [Aerococcus loyolae]